MEAEFKSKDELETLRGEQTLSELAARFELPPNMIAQRKRQAVEGMVEGFAGKASQRREIGEA